MLLPCRPSVPGRSDSPDVGTLKPSPIPRREVRTVAAPSVIAMLNARAPRLQSADEVTGALAGQGGVERRSPPWQPLSTQPRRSVQPSRDRVDRIPVCHDLPSYTAGGAAHCPHGSRSATLDRLPAAYTIQWLSGAWSDSTDAPTGLCSPSSQPRTRLGNRLTARRRPPDRLPAGPSRSARDPRHPPPSQFSARQRRGVHTATRPRKP